MPIIGLNLRQIGMTGMKRQGVGERESLYQSKHFCAWFEIGNGPGCNGDGRSLCRGIVDPG